jgi:heptaprenyl diphosphate synthase
MKRGSIKWITVHAMLLSLALALSIAESFIPFGIPGAKLGLANLVILIVMHFYGFFSALLINVLRVLIASLATGTFLGMGFVMSLSGAMASFLLMYVAHRWIKIFTPVGVSILGAYSHSLAQILVAVIYYGTWGVFYYFPLMALISLATGTINGFAVELLVNNKALQRTMELKR